MVILTKAYDKVGLALQDLAQLVNPITVSCYYTGQEYENVVVQYAQNVTNLSKVTYNVFHNGANIYDTTSSMIDALKHTKPT